MLRDNVGREQEAHTFGIEPFGGFQHAPGGHFFAGAGDLQSFQSFEPPDMATMTGNDGPDIPSNNVKSRPEV